VAAPTPVNTPDAICALLELSRSVTAATAEFSCASLMFSGGPPSQSCIFTTPADACSASSVDCSTMAGATAATTPAITPTATSSTTTTAAAGGTPLFRSQRTGGHNTVHTISASTTGRMTTHVLPTTHARPHSAAATATSWTATTAVDRRCAR
jgi:hypothetical protein